MYSGVHIKPEVFKDFEMYQIYLHPFLFSFVPSCLCGIFLKKNHGDTEARRKKMFALDYDGTIADTNALKTQWIQKHLGLDVAPYNCDRTWCVPLIGEDSYNAMALDVYSKENGLKAGVVPGANEALKTFAGHGRVYVVTARDSTNAPFAEEWLRTNGLMRYIEKIVPRTGKAKADVARSLGCRVLVDDDIRHLMDMPRDSILPLLLKPGFDGEFERSGGIVLCRSWGEVVSEGLQ